MVQQSLFPSQQSRLFNAPFPSTRYQGSKRKLLEWLWANIRDLRFESVLDVFGGTGAVSHLFKTVGKKVIYNDYLDFNWMIGLALIQNADVRLSPKDVETVLSEDLCDKYPDFIQSTFANIYFTHEENVWLDRVVYNIDHFLSDTYQQAIARYALYQACIAKRPYNLFHRANLYMRLAEVERSFGNKATWDTPFETHFRAFVVEANAAVFDNGQANEALHGDALETPVGADLVYIDPPYLNRGGVGVDYRDFYHFLEGLTHYTAWPELVDRRSKHKRLIRQPSAWNDPNQILPAFEALVKRHRESTLIVSYRDDGIPTVQQLKNVLGGYKSEVRQAEKSQKYVLSIRDSHEILLITT